MVDLILFKTENYRLVVKQSDILLVLSKKEKFSNDQQKIKTFNEIRDIRPINREYSNATQFIYFDGDQQLECLGVSDIQYFEDFNEDDIIHFSENESCDGIIGFINTGKDIVPIIDILSFSFRWINKSKGYNYGSVESSLIRE